MAVTVTIRGRLRGGVAEMKKLHDDVTGATKEMAKAAGDISHRVFLNPQDERDFLGIDEWQTAEQLQAFSSDPRIQDFFASLFDGQPEVKLWVDAGWNQW
jgi:quinol monooxygenase YgiN